MVAFLDSEKYWEVGPSNYNVILCVWVTLSPFNIEQSKCRYFFGN